MNADWAQLESLLVDGVFTLQRCIGSTDHSGVFLAQSAPPASADVALKLIPVDPKSAQAQLARWQLAARLDHPHLLRIAQVGVCRLHETHYLYAAMEYADQTLAQVLERRALTEDEARDMLVPTLDALEYLHQANLVHGGLKPSNILVVGDQLKLASDRVRACGESGDGGSAADDIRSLGATLSLALTRLPPPDGNSIGEVEWPTTVSASFRDLVTRCSSEDPRVRPTLKSLRGWLRGEPLDSNPPAPESTSAPSPAPAPAPMTTPTAEPLSAPEVAPTPTLAPEPAPAPAISPAPATTPASHPNSTAALPSQATLDAGSPSRRASHGALPWVLGALAVAALLWAASRRVPVVEQGESQVERSAPAVEKAEPLTPSRVEPASPAGAAAPAPVAPKPVPPAVATAPVQVEAKSAPPAASGGIATVEVMPAVAKSALDTVRGTIRVVLRVEVDRSGAVVAVTSDEPGPSRYFERRCLDAASKWAFAPAQTDQPRSMRIAFAITRSGVTATATPLP